MGVGVSLMTRVCVEGFPTVPVAGEYNNVMTDPLKAWLALLLMPYLVWE